MAHLHCAESYDEDRLSVLFDLEVFLRSGDCAAKDQYRKKKLSRCELVMQKMEHKTICLATPARLWIFKRIFPWETRMANVLCHV